MSATVTAAESDMAGRVGRAPKSTSMNQNRDEWSLRTHIILAGCAAHFGGVEGGRDGVRMGAHVQVGGERGVARVARELALSMAFFDVMAQLMAIRKPRHAVPAASTTPNRPFEPLNAFLVEVDDEVILFSHIGVGVTPLDRRALQNGTADGAKETFSFVKVSCVTD